MTLDEAEALHKREFERVREALGAHDCCGMILITVFPNDAPPDGNRPIICGSIGNREPISRHQLLSAAFGEMAKWHAKLSLTHGASYTWRERFLRWLWRRLGIEV